MLLKNVDFSDVNRILNNVINEGIAFDHFDGAILDNYIIFSDHVIAIEGITTTYIIITEIALNEWSSSYDILLTDDTQIMYTYLEYFENNNVYQAN